MTATMHAAVVSAFGKPLSIDERPIPEPGKGQVLVRMVASGVCHTDLHAADGDWPVKPHLPFGPGHEGVGTVAAGRGVVTVKEGDRVGIPWLHSACGACEYCLTGWETLCPRQLTIRGSIVGTRKDLEEALDFAARGCVKAAINDVFARLKRGDVPGRVVLQMA